VTDEVPPRKPRRILRGIGIVAGVFIAWLFLVWPPPVWYNFTFPVETSFQAMRRHADPATASQRRYTPVPLEQIAPAMRRAVLVGEDHRFYEHSGFDYIEMRKALGYPRDSFSVMNGRDRADLARGVRRTIARGEEVRGASTITQQLAKNLYLSPSRNPLRKVKEAVTAARLELWLSKDRILELYLNTAEFGDEIWGVEAASQFYFRRPASRLTREQAATLAATLPHPRTSNPVYRPGRMLWKRNWILRRM
jgi:monofunctional biosynthetic peptidoglycan transglycosylase